MKTKTTLLISAGMLALTTLKAQTFPLIENFDTTTDSTLPAGWVGGRSIMGSNVIHNNIQTKASIVVLSNTGVSNSKAMRLKTNSTYLDTDTLISPLIGTLPANATLNFDYKYLASDENETTTETAIPFTFISYSMSGNLHCKIYVVEGTSSVLIHTIDSTNHVSSSSYKNISIPLYQWAGRNINIKFIHQTEHQVNATASRRFYIDNFSVNALATGIKENAALNGVKLYPNPTKSNFTLEAKEPVTIKVYNVMGQIVFTSSENKTTTNIDIDNQPSGVYVVEAIGKENSSSYRLIKE